MPFDQPHNCEADPQHASQRIAELAYAIWEREGRPQGRALEHWLRAQVELNRVLLFDPYSPNLNKDTEGASQR